MIIENLQDAVTVARHAQGDKDAQLIQLLEAMAKRIRDLEVRLDRLSDLTVGDTENALSFPDKVLEVIEVRSGTIRTALGITDEDDRDDSDFERRVIDAIDERSYSVFCAIEAEIDSKLESFSEGHAFAEAVTEAVKDTIAATVEELIDDHISTDFVGTDAEDVVRKGLRSIL